MDPVVKDILFQGGLAAIVILALLGWLEFRPSIEERKAREKTKDEIIERLSAAIERIADKIEAKL